MATKHRHTAARRPRELDPRRRGRALVIAHRHALAAREQTPHEQALARATHDRATGSDRDHDRLLVQMRAANEQLLLATLRADELAEETAASRSVLDDHAADREARKRAKDEFLAMLVYELSDPRAPIVSALALLAASEPSVHARERAVIEMQVRYLVDLVHGLPAIRDDGN
jgi:hypothetical protein